MANNKNFIAKNGVSTGDGYSMPDVRPSLLLDFANSKTLDPRITFTRGSTATYWDGKTTTKAEENLITYSQDVSQATWTETNGTLTNNAATAPDGTTTAAQFTVDTTSSSTHYIQADFVLPASSQFTTSFYVKANGYDYIYSRLGVVGDKGAVFNLSTGAVHSTTSNTTATITDVGNSWYRCTYTATSNSSTAADLYVFASDNTTAAADGNPIMNGDGTSGYYFWGAQCEIRSSATAYTPTTSSPIVKYQPTLQTAAPGEARFDHNPVTGESKGLLIEEARTNLATYSEAFNSWTKLYATVESNVAIAPDGTLTADKLVPDTTSSAAHRVSIQQGFTSGTSYAFSVYAKADEKQYLDVRWYDGNTNAARVVFDVSNGTVTNTYAGTGVVEDVGNGWYRCAVYASATNTSISGFALIYVEDTNTGGVTYSGNGYDGLYLWGAQFEQGSFPTSYIPTSGSTVTRSRELAYINDLRSQNLLNPENGTFYLEFQTGDSDNTLSDTAFAGGISINSTNYMGMLYATTGVAYLQPTHGQIGASYPSSSPSNGKWKTAMRWKTTSDGETEAQGFLNGGHGTLDTQDGITVFKNATDPDLTLGWTDFSTKQKWGWLRKVALWHSDLGTDTLDALTEE